MKPNHIAGTEKHYGGPKHKLDLPGRSSLLQAIHHPEHGIDVGSRELGRVERLAAWWGMPIQIKSLGDGAYRVRGAAEPSH